RSTSVFGNFSPIARVSYGHVTSLKSFSVEAALLGRTSAGGCKEGNKPPELDIISDIYVYSPSDGGDPFVADYVNR
ncbi:hypothetical protein LSH36_193g12073, partial [Paralvinella palmiformis]